MEADWVAIRNEYLALDALVHGNAARNKLDERRQPTFLDRLQ